MGLVHPEIEGTSWKDACRLYGLQRRLRARVTRRFTGALSEPRGEPEWLVPVFHDVTCFTRPLGPRLGISTETRGTQKRPDRHPALRLQMRTLTY